MEPGDRFGRLMAVAPADSGRWVLLCDCGLLTTATPVGLETRTECADCERKSDAKRAEEAAKLDREALLSTPYAQSLPHQREAHRIYQAALRSGAIVRPERCERCDSDSRVAGHHEDYRRPLDVVWLCHYCHNRRHLELRSIEIARFRREEAATC